MRPHPDTASPNAARLSSPLPACLGAALILRLCTALVFPNYAAPDEVFQYLEQAHRLVFSQGYVPWEFQVGLRSWLIPLLLAAPMALAHGFAPWVGLTLIRVLLCAAALPIVWCAVKWGERFHGRQGAWVAGLLTALWPDLVLMAPHPLEETLSADILLPAIYLVEACRGQTGLRSISAAGFLLGLAFALREQLAPAIAIAGIFLCRRSPQRWALALAAASLPVLAAGLLDWFTWGQMFRSFWMNIYLNLGRGVASGYFDSSSPAYYPLNLLYAWLWGALFIAYFGWQGARKLPVAGACAAAIIITHCLIAHKEMRFIFPATTLLIPLAGIGLAGACAKRKYLLMACILAGPYMSPVFLMMVQWQDSASTFYTALARQHPCLVSIQTWNRGFWPIFPVFDARTRFTGPPLPGEVAPDAIVASADTAQIPPGFTRQACAPESWIPFHKRLPEICYWTRPVTTCAQGPSTPFTLVFPPTARPFIIPGRLPPTL